MIDSTYCLLTYYLFCFYCISTRHMYVIYILDWSKDCLDFCLDFGPRICLGKMTWKMVS